MNRRSALLPALLALTACGSHGPPAEPSDVDLTAVRAGFHCDHPPTPADADACRVLGEFAAAGPVTAWPAAGETQVWLGVDHCVQPTAMPTYDTYQLVYVKAGTGSAPPAAIAASRVLAYSAVFGSDQLLRGADTAQTATLAAVARGQPADLSRSPELQRDVRSLGGGAFRSLVHTLSGRSVGDGPADTGIWFLRSDGTHLLLVGPRIQGGCASELFRVPR